MWTTTLTVLLVLKKLKLFASRWIGFELRKWTSNNLRLIQELKKEEPERTKQIENSNEFAHMKILGMFWDREEDYFGFMQNCNIVEKAEQEEILTKRQVLRIVMSIFWKK